jgi:hypothetical protein
MRLKKLVLALALASAFTVSAQSLDLSLGTGDWSSVSGQTLTGPQTFQAGPNAWAISPYTGSTMYSLQPTNPSNSYANMASALGMSSSSVTTLSAEIAAQNPQGGGNITNAAWVSKNFTFTSAASFKMYWTYTSTDYVPFNDGSITTLVNTGDANTLGKINGVTTQYLLLGATNPGTGNYSTDSYGSTGWQVVNYDVLSAGTYKLGFGIFNQGDTALSPVLNVNDGLGTVTKNGTTFGAVAPNDPTMPTVNPTPPAAPTVVSQSIADSVSTSTSNGASTVATSIAYAATAVTVAQSNAKGEQTPKVLNVVQTTVTTGTTPFVLTNTTTTPVTTTTVTTPVTTKVWSDNTTTTEQGTPVTTTSVTDSVSSANTQGIEVAEVQTQQNFTTRIDQFDQLQKQNSRLNVSLDSDSLSRFKLTEDGFSQRTEDERDWNFYINVNGANSNTVDSYKFNSSTYGLGYEKKIDNETIIGGQFNRVSLRTTGEQGGGDLSKDAVGIYALKIIDNFLLKTDIGYSVNKYNTGHNLPELGLNNWSSTKGNDKWIAIRAYFPEVPEFHNIRPYIGSRVEYNKRNATSDKGSEVSAVNYSALNSTTGIMEAGVRYEKPIDEKWTAIAEVGGNTAKLNTVSASAIYAADNNSSLIAKLVVQEQNGLTSNKLMIIGRINF